jgi:uncharacterized protein (DUF488 family)
MPQRPVIWTIGHSTRPIDEFIDVLRLHGIQILVDVRTIPRSRHNPQFNTDTLALSLRNAGLRYRHFPELGGLRKPKKNSINDGWRNASFRGYADYMQTDTFSKALEELMAVSRLQPTAIMCAEAVPWRCHRSLIADALVSRRWIVRNIVSAAEPMLHQLTSFAKIEHGVLTYPALADPSAPLRLF